MNLSSKSKPFVLGHSVKALPRSKKISVQKRILREIVEDSGSSLNSSVTSECKPNNSINSSKVLKNIYFTEENNILEKSQSKSAQKIQKMNQEISLISQQLQNSNNEISRLNSKIEKINKRNATKIQDVQEKHEIKLKKNKKDIDFLLNDMNSKSTSILAQTFMQKHTQDLEAIQSYYEKMINDLKERHEYEIKIKETEENWLLSSIKRKLEYIVRESSKPKHAFSREIEKIKDIIQDIQDSEYGNKENELESYEEMSTLESEQGPEKKSLVSIKMYKSSNLPQFN
ncbi:hypothetical protein SteCoe_34572 [Stentor coeruleus]|uniref:Uncharacterized protein n=1 Tax=Stentor coeruleus TaxID=5963 RepID=A0A1R2AUD2_9CILI|nr:hypothetical protein SteCoe_34572 [Stentor coeruleus]